MCSLKALRKMCLYFTRERYKLDFIATCKSDVQIFFEQVTTSYTERVLKFMIRFPLNTANVFNNQFKSLRGNGINKAT